jgi:hypothetical protein
MSALGQKQTFAVHQPMSALPPIATAKAKFRKTSCLLYSRKRTCAVQLAMSALGEKRTSRASGRRRVTGEDIVAIFGRLVTGEASLVQRVVTWFAIREISKSPAASRGVLF